MEPPVKRQKKKDKAKEKFERNGGFSQKHIRLSQNQAQTKNWLNR
jgi:hypothetical protein